MQCTSCLQYNELQGLPSQGGIIEKEAPNFRLELPSKSGDDLLSHKRNEVKFVGAGSIRSHAAWTEFMPVRVAKALANEWVKIHFHTQ
jgi:hypothetical protein